MTVAEIKRQLSPADAREQARVAREHVENLVCYFAPLADDLERWLAHGAIAPEMLTEVRDELRAITEALDTGASIRQLPGDFRPGRPRACHLTPSPIPLVRRR